MVERYKVLSNGAVYDNELKRIVKGATWDSDKAKQLQTLAVQKKRDILAAGALAAVEDSVTLSTYGTDAWVYEIGKAQTIKATTPDDPKSTDAARFLMQETGLSEKAQAQEHAQGVTLHLDAGALQALAQWLGGDGFDNYNYRKHDVIDAEPAQADEGEGADVSESGEKR